MSLKSMMDSAETAPTGRRRRRWLGCLPFVLVLAIVVAAGLYLNRHRDLLPIPVAEGCEVDSVDGVVDLSLDQMSNAGTIAAVAISRRLPERAVTISLATAMQESKLQNLTAGDRDSIGLFQQRPSQGWGTPAQIGDPVYATNKFLDKLVQIQGYAQLPLTVAAQDVQHSGYPDAYATHETDAKTLSGALTGRVPASLNCTVNSVGAAVTGPIGADGLQQGGRAVSAKLKDDFGATVTPKAATAAGSADAAGGSPSASASADSQGLGLTVGTGSGTTGTARGWAVAQWAVANCQDLHITSVSYGGKVWRSSDSTKGWQASGTAAGSGPVRISVAAKDAASSSPSS
ncbi:MULTISPECIES: hypothetical protein [Streptacidiphilus]|uniref:ARB-07466-like C-terminal domain-containing protein n=1 Tax=Streptacidiphilus cavernicola TaxID=3342716 RepID=A0ABV6UHI1_9ACTN|nr:hypothetical protein [Streptacidiphilus jeojiense]